MPFWFFFYLMSFHAKPAPVYVAPPPPAIIVQAPVPLACINAIGGNCVFAPLPPVIFPPCQTYRTKTYTVTTCF